MLRSIMAVVAGFSTMAVVVMVGSIAIVAAFIPGGFSAMRALRDGTGAAMPAPTPRYLVMNIALSLVAAILGGWITARIASRAVNGHLIALCLVIVLMGVVSAFGSGSGSSVQPAWYKFVIPLVGIAGVGLSAMLTQSG